MLPIYDIKSIILKHMEPIKIEDEQRLQILLSAAEERYKSIHLMRERVYKFSTWAIGVLLVVVGWIAKAGTDICFSQRVFITLAILAASGSISLYIRDIRKGFDSNFSVLVKIERLLGFFTPGFFGDSDKSLYPEKWSREKRRGEKRRPGKFFNHTYLIIWVCVVIALFTVWLA